MPSVTRLFVHSMLITVTAAVTLMFAVPAALADGCPSPSTLVFAVQPTTTQVQTAMTPAVVVDVENSQGYLESSFNGPVTLTYAVNPVGAPEPANNVVYAVGGVATFPALTFSAIGIGFELQASAEQATSSPSQPFGIATTSQAVTCQPGQTCQSPTVSSDGTSGFAVASAAGTTDVLTASAGFPPLSCTKFGGVLGFFVPNRSKVITLTLAGSAAPKAKGKNLDICFGSPTPFITENGKTSKFNPADNLYEGALPSCQRQSAPCIASQARESDGSVVSTIDAPPGDPWISF
jgi:hypothetical protein